ncbi:MAG: hypothetical protein R3C45_11335 [Phycisphaerales bacterium]
MTGVLSCALTLAFDIQELSPTLNIAIPLLGVVLITIGMMMGIRKKRRQAGARSSSRDRVDELRQKQAVRGDLEQLMTEVEQLAKRFGTQLDAKTMQMERLIDEADRKIAELKQLEQARRAAMSLHTPEPSSYTAQPSANPQPPTPNPQPAPSSDETY